jgi:hypothetical protein
VSRLQLTSVGLSALLAVVLLALSHRDASAAAGQASKRPTPPPNATVYARRLGNDVLALAVVPLRGNALLVQASVVGRQGNGIDGKRIAFNVAGRRERATPCGAGCYRASFSPRTAPRAIDVIVAGSASATWRIRLPSAWPPKDGAALVRRAARVWRSLHSVTFRERLSGGNDKPVISTWRIQAPDRVAYDIVGGWSAVIIGTRRWDRAPGAHRWERSTQTPLHQIVPPWVSSTDAHILREVTYDGRRAVQVSFYDTGSNAWFRLTVETATGRTLETWMVTNAHFMLDVFRGFNATPAVRAPA